jgi:long-chain fatty acid transport protein
MYPEITRHQTFRLKKDPSDMKTPRTPFRSFCGLIPKCPLAMLVAGLSISRLGVTDSFGIAFRLPNQNPEAIARGNAFVATADNPSAIYYNPAAITQLEGHNFNVGLYMVSADTDYTSPTGAKAYTDGSFQLVPQFYYTYSPKESPLSFGLGIYSPYGLSLDWGQNAPFKNLAKTGKLVYSSINPVVAWQLHPTLSLGIGPTINYSMVEFKQALSPSGEFRFQGDDTDFGFNAGLFWKPHDKWAFGVNYRYLTTETYRGNSEASPFFAPTRTVASVRFPQFVVAGVSFRPTEKWNIEFDVDWTDWDNVNQILFQGTSFGNVPFVLNYRSSFMYEIGVTRSFDNGWFASVGYFFSENSSPDVNFNPIVPDGDLHLGSFGFGRKGKRWDWAIAYHFGSNGSGRVVRGSTPGGLADGTYKTFNQAVNVSATLKF